MDEAPDLTPSAAASDGASEPAVSARRAKRILAFGGGKGGVGKSLLAANVSVYLAQLGKRVEPQSRKLRKRHGSPLCMFTPVTHADGD